MIEALGEPDRLLHPSEGLIGEAEDPEGPGEVDAVRHAGIMTGAQRGRAVLPHVVEAEALLRVLAAGSVVALE